MARLGVLGGTFDPPHLGHLVVASEVAHLLALDEVVFVPTGEPWQKAGTTVSAAADRVAMTRLAVAADDRFSVSTVDVDRGGTTYTRDTLVDLRKERGDEHAWFFVVGADALALLPTWRYVPEVFDLATFVAVGRPGHAGDPGDLPVTVVESPLVDVSGTDLRSRVARGAPIRYLVPDAVAAYVADHRLYTGAG